MNDLAPLHPAEPAPDPRMADEENLRLLTSFNDLFVSLAIVLVLGGIGWLGGRLSAPTGWLAAAAVSWPLAEVFTLRKRMALPSILLQMTFTGGLVVAAVLVLARMPGWLDVKPPKSMLPLLPAGIAWVGAASLFWFRFRVPIAVASATSGVLVTVVVLLLSLFPALKAHADVLSLLAGLATFAVAMRWDLSDPGRGTIRSDVAFWLHLSAAPLIVRPLFAWIGVTRPVLCALSPPGGSAAVAPSLAASQVVLAVLVYLALGLVAVAIDRRAGLVAGLAYIVYAVAVLLRATATVGASLAMTALAVGGSLLMLSVFWRQTRHAVLAPLPPAWRARLPRL